MSNSNDKRRLEKRIQVGATFIVNRLAEMMNFGRFTRIRVLIDNGQFAP